MTATPVNAHRVNAANAMVPTTPTTTNAIAATPHRDRVASGRRAYQPLRTISSYSRLCTRGMPSAIWAICETRVGSAPGTSASRNAAS